MLKLLQQSESFSANLPIVAPKVIEVISKKTLCSKVFTNNLRYIFI